MEDDGPKADDPAGLDTICVPVLVVKGSDTRPFLADRARFVVDHAPKANLREVPGAGRAAAHTHPKALAEVNLPRSRGHVQGWVDRAGVGSALTSSCS